MTVYQDHLFPQELLYILYELHDLRVLKTIVNLDNLSFSIDQRQELCMQEIVINVHNVVIWVINSVAQPGLPVQTIFSPGQKKPIRSRHSN